MTPCFGRACRMFVLLISINSFLKAKKMAKTTLKTGSTSNGEAAYAMYVENILVKLAENTALFSDVGQLQDDLEESLRLFKQAQAEAAYRDRRMIVLKNQALAKLKRRVYQLSLYVESKAGGDAATILAAGYVPSISRGPQVAPAPKPSGFSIDVQAYRSGLANLKVKGWRPVLAYQFEYRRKDSGEPWNHIISSKCRLTVTGLIPLQEYEFRVAYIGRNPQITYSDIISSYVF